MASSGTTSHSASDITRLLEFARSRQRVGALQDADNLYGEVLTRDATCASAWFLRSTVSLAAGETARAAEQLEMAVHYSPQTSLYHCNLGEAYRRLGRIEEAVDAARRAITLKHDFAEAHRNLGLVLEQAADLQGALASFEAAWRLQPSLPGCAARIVALLRACGRSGDAVVVFHLSERHIPNDVDLAIAGASALADLFQFDEAIGILKRRLTSGPPGMLARVQAALAKTLADCGQVEEALAHLRRAIELVPTNPAYHAAVLYLMTLAPGAKESDLHDAATRYGQLLRPAPDAPPIRSDVDPTKRPLRVGYVASCLRSHPDVHFVLPLLTHHNPERVTVLVYSNTPAEDEVTQEIRGAVEGFTVLRGKSDADAAELVRRDEVDILVDVTAHAEGGRPGLFARRPAPLQVTWLARPGTTGLSAVDYALSDPNLLTSGKLTEFTENIYPLEHALWCYAPLAEVDVNRLPALSRSWFTFGSFCPPNAINDTTIALWVEVLRVVGNARLRLLASGTEHQQRLARAFERQGIGRVRLDFIMPGERDKHLREYHLVDCCLDAVPANGVLSTFDSWWMGVPVISQRGTLASGRVGHAVASHLGLRDFIANDRAEYISAAVRVANHLDALATLRRTLRQRMERSALMDGPLFARSVEAAYRAMWSEHRERT